VPQAFDAPAFQDVYDEPRTGGTPGWWDGVQPGLGNERAVGDCLTLKDLNPAALDVIRRRRREIAGVLVNPIQSFHPNAPPPNDAVLLTSGARKTGDESVAYRQWLQPARPRLVSRAAAGESLRFSSSRARSRGA
jgi:hypothetical protein